MTIHYHGTPISPHSVFVTLAGRCFCVSFAEPKQIESASRIAQLLMLDNGAFSAWRRGYVPDWLAYYAWTDVWLNCPTTWAVIPDVVDGGAELQDRLIAQWPHGQRGAPVWHMDEPIERLLRLLDTWQRVCVGSTSQYQVVGNALWHARMVAAWNAIAKHHKRTPNVHLLRGMRMAGNIYPFASLDSTDIARNHSHPKNNALRMANRWDAVQCPAVYRVRALTRGFL